jgi:hypothetical protein
MQQHWFIIAVITPMTKKRKPSPEEVDLSKDLWIAPRFNLRGPDGNRAWDNRGNITPTSGARVLELADIALGNKKSSASRKKAAAAGVHQTRKTEPYIS